MPKHMRPAGAYKLWLRAVQRREPMVIVTARACSARFMRELLQRALRLHAKAPPVLPRRLSVISVNSQRCLQRYGARYPTAAARKCATLKAHMKAKGWQRVCFVDDDLRNLRAMRALGSHVELRSGRTGRRAKA